MKGLYMNGVYVRSIIAGIIGVAIILLMAYGILAIGNAGQSERPVDVVQGWVNIFFISVAAVCSLFLIGVISAWWTGNESHIWEALKSSLISGLISVTILMVMALIMLYMYLGPLSLIFGLFYLIAIIFSPLGAMFYVFIIRGAGSSLVANPLASAYSVVSGLISGSVSMGFIALSWNGLGNITVFQLFEDLLLFSIMSFFAGVLAVVLLRRKMPAYSGHMLQAGIAGLIAGALTFLAPFASLMLKGSSIRGISLIAYSMAIPLPLIGGVVLASIGGTLANYFACREKATGVTSLSGLYHVKLAIAGGILMALFIFSPILITWGASSIAYHEVNNTVTMASFFIVPIGEAIIGLLAVRYGHARSMRDAAATAGITGAISIFIIFIGDMAKSILYIHGIVDARPILDMHAYGSMTNAILCYPFVLLALITIAICSGVLEYGRKK